MTAYEKKCYSLQVQFLRNLGVEEAVLKKTSVLSDVEKLLEAADFLQKLNTERGIRLMLALQRELKEAEKLKTAVDFQRDKAKKEEAERKKQIELAKDKERQRQYETKKKEQEKQERFEKSDFVAIRNKINESFIGWLQKGEFEKSDDYRIRINSYSVKVFDSLCFKTILQAFKEKNGFNSKLLKYNADTENFGIEFTFNDSAFKDSVHVPVNDASKFKNNFDDFEISVNNIDWMFIDNYLYPKKISLFNRNTDEEIEYNFSNEKAKKIVFSSSDFGENFPSINTNFVFENAYLNDIFENKDTSTINNIASDINRIAWENLMEKNYKRALYVLENAIPLIEETDEIYPYLLGNLAHAYLFTNQFEKAHKVYFDNIQRKLQDMTWKEAILEDFSKFKTNGIISADIDKIMQEIKKL
jgi:hypothetical protein